MLFANTNPAVLEACTLCRHKTWKSAFRRQCHICCEVFSRLLWGRLLCGIHLVDFIFALEVSLVLRVSL